MVKAGIIGAGGVGEYFARRMSKLDDIALKAICDIREDAAKKIALKYKAKYFTRYTDLVKEDLDVVFVCTTNASHCECVLAAAKADIPNIYCEKPMSLSVKEAEKMTEA